MDTEQQSRFKKFWKGFWGQFHRSEKVFGTCLILIAASLSIIHHTMPLFGKHLAFLHVSDIATILFGFTDGMLSLIGLIAIFISLNTQHRIEKCRELYWEMIVMENSNPYEFSKRFQKSLWLFSKILNNKESLVLKASTGVRWTIIFVLVIWSLFVGLTDCGDGDRYTYLENTAIWIGLIFSVFTFLFLFNLLGQMNDLTNIASDVPTVKNLLTVSKQSEVENIYLAATTAKLSCKK
jgi:hypothetical protein